MKINSIPPNSMVESYKEKMVKPAQGADNSYKPDRVEFSDDAKSFASVIKEVKDKLDTRAEGEKKHIEEVARQVENGTYSVDSSEVIEKMLGGSFDITV